MTKPQIKIVNAETGEEIIREMNAEELAQWEIDQTAAQAEAQALATKELARQEVLAQLGITAEQAKLLLS
jgi:rRNA maturation endonuclease Nob1